MGARGLPIREWTIGALMRWYGELHAARMTHAALVRNLVLTDYPGVGRPTVSIWFSEMIEAVELELMARGVQVSGPPEPAALPSMIA